MVPEQRKTEDQKELEAEGRGEEDKEDAADSEEDKQQPTISDLGKKNGDKKGGADAKKADGEEPKAKVEGAKEDKKADDVPPELKAPPAAFLQLKNKNK